MIHMTDPAFLEILETRFRTHPHRHADIRWSDVQAALMQAPQQLQILKRMAETGGEPDVIGTAAGKTDSASRRNGPHALRLLRLLPGAPRRAHEPVLRRSGLAQAPNQQAARQRRSRGSEDRFELLDRILVPAAAGH